MDPLEKYNKLFEDADSIFNRLGNAANRLLKPQNSDFADAYVEKHKQDMESGAECSGLKVGDKPNGLFWSATGSIEGIFGRNRNKVDDLGDLEITKRELRCYDVSKDIYNIEWLYDNHAKFHAKKIWGNSKTGIHFEGEWFPGGIFKGIWEGPVANFKAAPQFFKDKRGITLQQLAQMNSPQTPQAPAPTNGPSGPPKAPEFYYYDVNGSPIGPLPFHRLKQAYTVGAINKDTLAWREGLPGQTAANAIPIPVQNLPEFKALLPE